MRPLSDRIRHALAFEAIALLLIVPLSAALFHEPLAAMGVVTLVSATVATVWNVIYNHLFDRALRRITGTTLKSRRARLVHAVLFEAGLLVALLPFIAWYLGVTLLAALVMGAAFAAFYVVYAYLFNLAYDRLFPLPDWQRAAAPR